MVRVGEADTISGVPKLTSSKARMGLPCPSSAMPLNAPVAMIVDPVGGRQRFFQQPESASNWKLKFNLMSNGPKPEVLETQTEW